MTQIHAVGNKFVSKRWFLQRNNDVFKEGDVDTNRKLPAPEFGCRKRNNGLFKEGISTTLAYPFLSIQRRGCCQSSGICLSRQGCRFVLICSDRGPGYCSVADTMITHSVLRAAVTCAGKNSGHAAAFIRDFMPAVRQSRSVFHLSIFLPAGFLPGV